MSSVIEERWLKVKDLSLKVGAHSPDSTFCVMEAVAYVAGEKWSDAPECACPVIGTFLRSWNDALPTDRDRNRLLKPLIPKLVGTRNKAFEERRSLMCADWLVRVHTVAWLRLAGLNAQADRLESLPEITSKAQIPSIKPAIEAVREAAAAARAAARATARATGAAWAAAWDAAWVAAGVAAWVAAGDAVWAAAWDAARDAARAAAGKKLAPTVANLQQSALELVERMIALSSPEFGAIGIGSHQ